MRFFSNEWALLDDAVASQRIVTDYEKLLHSLPGATGEKIRSFNNTHSLQDALLDQLEISPSEGLARFQLIVGDNQIGYSVLTLQYKNARVTGCSLPEIAETLDRRSSVVRYDEFDLAVEDASPPKFTHRFLIWPPIRKEFEIEFYDFGVSTKVISGRHYETYGEAFVLGN